MHLIGYVLIMTYRIFKRIFQPLLCWYASNEKRSYTEIVMDGIIRCYMLLIEIDYGLEIYRQSFFKWDNERAIDEGNLIQSMFAAF